MRLVGYELFKLRTTRTFAGLVLGGCLLSMLIVLPVLVTSERGGAGGPIGPRGLTQMNVNAFIVAIALGVITVTGESRHHTEAHTFLGEPNRSKVVLAKAVAAFCGGIVMGLAAEVAVLALGIPWLRLTGTSISFDIPALAPYVIGNTVGVAMVTVLGAAIGTIIRNQIAAVLVGVGWLLVAEQAIQAIFFANGARESGFLVEDAMVAIGGSGMPRWAGLVLMVSYLLVLGGIGTFLTERRDITA